MCYAFTHLNNMNHTVIRYIIYLVSYTEIYKPENMIPIFVSCQPEHASLSHYLTIYQICDLLQVLLYQYGKKPVHIYVWHS